MNTAKIKAYAPQARREFIQAVTDKASLLGLSRNHVEPMEIKGDVAIIGGKAFPKKVGKLRGRLQERIQRQGFDQVMEAMAYTWFNRFVALRYMELHDYLEHGYRVLSSRSGSEIPELLEHAAEVNLPGLDKERVVELRLAGDKDNELYRMLLVAQCNALHKAMPFLFGRIDDQTELLLPDNLLHSQSPIRKLVEFIDEADWQEVEIIGWIYQFYISEKKDEVIGKVVQSEDIPAATQLFTPNWIVKYMVQNTLGRQWLATYPDSPLKEKMEYYIEPGEQTDEVKAQLAANTPAELDPESITLMDPACGSGHILVEAYDTFKEIYLERGYRTRDIPRLILEKNLYGLEIDDRAAQLASFALLMKARADDRRSLDPDQPVQLNILAIQESKGLDADEIAKVLLQERVIEFDSKKPRQQEMFSQRVAQPILSKVEKPELNREDVVCLIDLFKEGKTFGSLLNVPNQLKEALPKFEKLVAKARHWDVHSSDISTMLLPLVRQTEFLAGEYDCIVTNPPYMGGKGLNTRLKSFAQHNYPSSKSDLFSVFAERVMELVPKKGHIGLMTPITWMFLSSYERFRDRILHDKTLTSLVRPEYHAFFDSAYVPICTFALFAEPLPEYRGGFVDLTDFYGADLQPVKAKEAIKNPNCGWFFRTSAEDFKKIPGSPIACWVSKNVRELFEKLSPLGSQVEARVGLMTSDNDKFLRYHWEVSLNDVCFHSRSSEEAASSSQRWFPHNKGGTFRKWSGNYEYLVNWENNGQKIKETVIAKYPYLNGNPNFVVHDDGYYFRPFVSWSEITSASTAFRFFPSGFTFNVKGMSAFEGDNCSLEQLILLCNSKLVQYITKAINPTISFGIGNFNCLPAALLPNTIAKPTADKLITSAKKDWDSYETSWDFTSLPLLQSDYRQPFLKATYTKLRTCWHEMSQEMQRLEEENNRIFIETYGLQDELTPEVSLSEITLTCNPHYRYGNKKSDEELESLLLTDTIKELISYAVGSMMGRYSLDHPGLIYAYSGNIGFDPAKYPSFPADEDGIVPIMDMDWFPDDATHRLVEFLKVAWPPETLEENLKFLADSLSPKRGEPPVDTIRRYFSASFFKDHLKTYKRRPIYWLFSSGKQKAFECLVYLHRYNEATLSRMRGAYVTPLQGKLNARIEYLKKEVDAAETSPARKRLQKELDVLNKKQVELARFDEELRHYADQKIALDLDDGVKVNYGKFGNLLAERKAVTGK